MSVLKKRDIIRKKRERPIGILHVRRAASVKGLTRYWPSPDLAPFVEHYWVVRWNLREPRIVETMPSPVVHLVLEARGSEVVGVMRQRFSRVLSGRGRAIGTRFRPGAFRAFLKCPVFDLTGRRLRLRDVFGPEAASLGERALRHDDDRRAIAVIERF